MGQWVTRWVNGSMGQWVMGHKCDGSDGSMGQWVMGHKCDGSDGSWVTDVDPWSTLIEWA